MPSVTRSRTVHPILAILAIAGLALGGLATSLAAPPSARGATHVVTIGDGFFTPADLSISAGDTVTWVNEDDSPHTATGDVFDSGNMDPGASFSFTFDAAGAFGYVCSYHDEMVGSITVTAAQGAAAAPTQAAAAESGTGGAAAASPAATHAGGHQAAQPNTALPARAPGIASGWLATVLIGLALVAFAFAFMPVSRSLGTPPARRSGGWRR